MQVYVQVAMEQFSEATVGYRSDTSTAKSWVQAFGTPYFHVAAVSSSYFTMTASE
jgi:glycerol-3-phosphate dehydrogenase (NAD+)